MNGQGRLLAPGQAEWRYLLLSALQWLPVGLVLPVLVLIFRARGIELPVIGLLVALGSAAVIALELPTGGLADVFGRRNVLILSRLLAAAALLAFSVAGDAFAFALATVLSAMARALQSGPLEAWYVDTVRAADPEADVRGGISRAWAAEASGIALGALAGGLLPSLATALPPTGLIVPLSLPFLAAAVLTQLGLLAVVVLMKEPPRTVAQPSIGDLARDVPATVMRGIRLARGDRTIKLVLGATVSFGFALSALEIMSPLQFASLVGEERASGVYGILVTLAFLGTATGSAGAPRAAQAMRSGPRAAALFAALVAFGLAGMAIGAAVLVLAAVYVVVYLFAGVAGPLNNETLHMRVTGEQRATLLSVASLAQQLGGLSGALIVPLVASISFGAGWLAAAAVALVGATLLALLPRTIPRTAAQPAVA